MEIHFKIGIVILFCSIILIAIFIKEKKKDIKKTDRPKEKESVKDDTSPIPTSFPTSMDVAYKEPKEGLIHKGKVYSLPPDYSRKQKLSNKYNVGTYRDEKGRFQSLSKYYIKK
tara:strand:+ start:801 stop:1142 length:342 start_codon:yes stop_codon:yes gene_type:complete